MINYHEKNLNGIIFICNHLGRPYGTIKQNKSGLWSATANGTGMNCFTRSQAVEYVLKHSPEYK